MPKLTKRFVDSVVPTTRDIVLWDTELPRFGLRVKPSGVMTYVVQYRNSAGRTRKLKLGRVDLNAERVLANISTISAEAQDAGDYTSALRGLELLGKAIGMFATKSAHRSVKMDASKAHLAALVAQARKRNLEPV